MVLLEISIYPIDKGMSLSTYVARLINIIEQSGLPFQTGPMGTVIEGELPPLLNLVQKLHDELATDCARIIAHMKLDSKPGARDRMRGKIKSLEQKLGHPIPKQGDHQPK